MNTIGNQYTTNLSITPNYIALYYSSIHSSPPSDNPTIPNLQPKSNNPKRFISEKSQKRIRKAVNWLGELAIQKDYYNPKKEKYHSFKINFLTLTLPALQAHHDTTIKKECLDPLLTNLRKTHKMNNYIWRAEAQANGSIHFHILTDCYIDHYILRQLWNRQLERLGYVSRYSKKFETMSFEDYCREVDPNKKTYHDVLQRRYEWGKKTNWKSPNTTDIHPLHTVKNIGAYISKYMSKDEVTKGKDGRYELKSRRIGGKKVGISEKLSRLKGFKEELTQQTESIINKAIDRFKSKVLNDDWFSIIIVSWAELREIANDWIEELRAKVMKSVEYIPSPPPSRRKRLVY